MNDTTKKSVSEAASANAKKSQNPAYAKSLAAVRVLISGNVSERQIPARGERPERTRYEQRAMIVGTPASMPISVNTYDREQTQREGVYLISNEALRLDEYGGIKLNTFGNIYIYLNDLTDDQRLMLEAVQTDASDLM